MHHDTVWLSAREAASYAGYKTDKTIRRALLKKDLHGERRTDKHPWRTKKEWVDQWLSPAR